MKRHGFTLLEILFAVVLVGLAVVSLLASNISFTQANGYGADLSTAEFLIEQIRELTVMTGYDDLYAFDGSTFCPPINANGQQLQAFAAFTQQITVENVSNTDFEDVVADNSSDFTRIIVKVLLNSKQMSSSKWIRAHY